MPSNSPPPLETRSTAELSRLAYATRPDIARQSLKALVRRRDPVAPRLARDLLHHHADEDVRATAAVTLGREPDDVTQEVLLHALGDPNPVVLRRVAQSLGRVGDVRALRALKTIDTHPHTPTARAVATAMTLLSYRLHLTDHLVDPDETGLATFRVSRGAEIEWGGRLPRSRASIAADAARELPGVDIDPRTIIGFVCSGQPGAFVANHALATVELLVRPLLAGAVLRERVCSEHYSLDAYVLVDDRDETEGASPHVWLMRPDGIVVHHGRATVTDDGVEFRITDSNAPYSRPVHITGQLSRRGAISMTTAIIGKPRAGSATATTPAARTLPRG